MAFLLAEKEARNKEKEEEKLARAKERQEDMEQIKIMIQSGVKEEVRSEIHAVVEPLKEKLEQQEKETSDLKKQFQQVLDQVKNIREISNNYQHFPALPASGSLSYLYRASSNPEAGRNDTTDNTDSEHANKVRELCADARKVVGFTPIEPRMLELQMTSYNAKDQDEAMMMEIRSYLNCEMKMSSFRNSKA